MGIGPASTKTSVRLLPHQVEHYMRVLNIVEKHRCYFDSSSTGTGKTVICGKLSNDLQLPLFVISPKSVIVTWKELSKEFDFPLKQIITYQKLRGKKNMVNHPYLEYFFRGFITTSEFDEIAQQGILLVFDEVHNLKNVGTRQQKAAIALVHYVMEHTTKSVVALLSASPFDKVVHSISVMKMLGNNLGSRSQILKFCRNINRKKTDKYASLSPFSDFCWKLYKKVVAPEIVSTMSLPELPPRDFKNGYYQFNDSDLSLLEEGEERLKRAVKWVDEEAEAQLTDETIRKVTVALYLIERSKLNTLIRLASQTLHQPNSKVIVYCWFRNSIEQLKQKLTEKLNIRVESLHGKTKLQEREDVINTFQQPDNTLRCIITSPPVGGIGISLHDTHGNFPRYIYAIPSYHFISLLQACGRTYRTNVKSTATIRFVYSADFVQETMIFNAMIRKSNVTKKSRCTTDDSLLFPCDFDGELEDTQGKMTILSKEDDFIINRVRSIKRKRETNKTHNKKQKSVNY